MMTGAVAPEVATARAYMALRDAVIAMGNTLLGEGETYETAAIRLEKEYGIINAPIGVRSQHLVRLLMALDLVLVSAPIEPETLGSTVQHIQQRAASYGPQRRAATQTLPPGEVA